MTAPVAAARGAYVPSGDYTLIIGGEPVATDDGFDAIDPSVGTPWTRLPQATEAHVDAAVAAATRAFATWRRTTASHRQRVLWEMADRVEAEPDRWASLLATENGRPIREAYAADVPTCAGILRYFSGLARDHRGDQIPLEDPGSLAFTVREPLGVIAALIPWNSPIITLANKVGPALAAGNTLVIKPSEYASASVIEFVRAVEDLVPAGVLNVVTGFGPSVGAALVSHPGVAKITFTGGSATARRIMAAAGGALTPSIMELGGKGAMVVCADADLDLAVADAMTGIYMANGEVCVAASRLLVHESVHDEFAERFAALARGIVVGDALDPATQFGPLVSAAQLERVRGCIDAAVAQGAVVRTGGAAPELPAALDGGFFLAPTLLEDPAGATSASREEIFGPVTVLERFASEDAAVARANEGPYGLAAGVWTRDLARAHRIAGALEAGIVWVNKWFDLPAGVPMGGIGDSGFGRELSAETMLEYSAPKAINIGLGDTRPALWGR
ncbi:aldehyde dehydrogenase family protein [Capillimicrobium parvum]|uniref:(Z)-2-((N-methylformamido)methylene)-5-hydroxybutyrolactone dehydrogenase n=1 Tax=Capillimicrobium parvum TaxID=2884022 RepID=A0A9E6XS81_9ACTN|nr:aldehyde dehydrogenase family protein [Capillimicrobium parvum]UGS33821.1 (Z)-2-((N-methylformamido)methylene)-5-hydroxybutyrolactone dehydrogenase [Capillimicrobium parvum]